MATRNRAPAGASTPAIMGTFVAGLAGAGVLARALGRETPRVQPVDLAALGVATFKAARTVVARPGREASSASRSSRATRRGEDPVETGDLRQAIGELVTCSRCVGTWVAAGLTTTQVVAPRFGRLLTWSLAAAGANDFLQAGFVALARKSD